MTGRTSPRGGSGRDGAGHAAPRGATGHATGRAAAAVLALLSCRPTPPATPAAGAATGIEGEAAPAPRRAASPTEPPRVEEPPGKTARPKGPAPDPAAGAAATVEPLDLAPMLAALGRRFPDVLADPHEARFQLVITCLDERGPAPSIRTARYRAGAELVYPASAIKLFVTAAALAMISSERAAHPDLGWDSPIAACDDAGRCRPIEDPSNRLPPHAKVATVGHLVRRVHLVSDNVAYNLLYDLVGHEALHRYAWDRGLASLRVHHRMFSWAPPRVQRTSPAFRVGVPPDALYLPKRTSALDPPPLPFETTTVGRAHIDPETKQRVAAPMDFSHKNYASLVDHHRLLLSIVRPDLRAVAALDLVETGIDEDLRARLVAAMTEDPNASPDPAYPPPHRGAAAFKPMLPGIARRLPGAPVVYTNKAGRAYGFHVENAVVRHEARTAAVTVSIYGNRDGVLNDDRYDYDRRTRPFLAAVGEAVADLCLASPPPAR